MIGVGCSCCASQGNERWVEQLDTKFQEDFAKASKQPWVTLNKGELSGWVRSAGGDGFTAGNVTYVQVHAAGYVHVSLVHVAMHAEYCCPLGTWCH